MSTIRSFSTLALALGAAAAPPLEIVNAEVSVGPVHVPAGTLTLTVPLPAGTQLRREAAFVDLPKQPPAVHTPTLELPKLPEISQGNADVPSIPEIKIKPEPIQTSIAFTDDNLHAPRAVATPGLPVQLKDESIVIALSTPVVIPAGAVTVPQVVHARETLSAPPVNFQQVDVPREKAPALPTISIKPLSANLPTILVDIPKLPRRNVRLPQVPSQTAVDFPALSTVLSSLLGALATRPAAQAEAHGTVIVGLPAVTSVVSILGDVKASLVPRQPVVEPPVVKVEAVGSTTTIDLAAVNTVIAMLSNKVADSVSPRGALVVPEAEAPSVTVDVPIVSSALSVLGSVASAGFPIKAARGQGFGGLPPIGNIPSTSVTLGINVPAFTIEVPIPAEPVLPRSAVDLPLTTLIQVASVSKVFDLVPVETKVLKVPAASL